MSAGGGGGFFQRVSNFFHPGGGQGVGLAPPQAGYPGAAHHQQQQHQQGQPGNPYAPVAYPPPQMHRKTPTFAELLYRAMLRRGPEKKEKIQEAFRYLKQHPGLPQDEVLARLASALGENFVSLCWKEARIQLYEAQRAAGQQGGGQQGFGPFGGGGGAGGGRGADEEAVDEQVEEQVEGQELAAMHDGDDDDNVTDEAHVKYEPSRVKGGVPHPGYVVETKALAGVIPTPLTFKTRIPRRVVEAGKVSLLQLEAAMYGMQMHERRLPSGERAGWVLADGTGIGKGRIIASIIFDNHLRGRDRAVWVTASPFLAQQIKRDVKDVGLRIKVHELSSLPLKGNANIRRLGPGLMITTYRTLIGQADDGTTRVDQLISWLGGEDWDGVLALDEAHKAKSLKTTAKKKGKKGQAGVLGDQVQASKTALTIFQLQHTLKNARVVYSSATIATNPDNLECLLRLGLWGPRTSFKDSAAFADAMRNAGLPGLELLALNLKSEGKFLSRCLGFKGCEFQVVRAPISPEFEQVYDLCARQWELLRQELELMCPPSRGRRRNGGGGAEVEAGGGAGGGGPFADVGRGKATIKVWTQFWSSHQRFFKSLYVASKVPFVVELAQQALADGYAPVIGLQITGEASMQARQGMAAPPRPKRGGAEGEAEDEEAYDEVSHVAHTFEQFIRNHVTEILGPGVPELQRRYLQWLDGVRARLPGNPLDTLIDALGGPAQVAELTGRSLRRTADKKHAKVNVGQQLHERERKAFQAGTKKAAIISEAASVGISLHADRREPSAHKRRVHFCLELAWGADRVMQQLGRTHRSNQASGPIYKLMTSERMGGDTRFVATVARRLQVLGAITQGHEGAANKTLDLREFNVESVHGERALVRLLEGYGIDPQALQLDGVRRALELLVSRMRKDLSVPRFLNTVLGFELGVQEAVVGGFFRLWGDETARAKLDGTYSQRGILNLKGEKVEVRGQPTTYIAPPLAGEAAPGNWRGGRGQGNAAAAAAAAAAALGAAADVPAPVPAPADGGDEKEEEEKQKLTVVTLSLDRGLSYGHALQMLLLATGGGSGERGGSGFYLPKGQPGPSRPLLALQRAGGAQTGDGPVLFKVLWADVGREAYMDRTREDLLEKARFLTPQEAEPLWTQRYEGALTTCAPHGGTRCCSVGKRLKTCHLLKFNLVQHWQRVKAVVGKGKKRMRVVRAETTAVPSKRFVGVMLSVWAKRRLERQGLAVVPLEENPNPVVITGVGEKEGAGEGAQVKVEGQQPEDTRVDIFTLLEDDGAGAVVDLVGDDDEDEEEDDDDDAMTLGTLGSRAGKAAGRRRGGGGGGAGGGGGMIDLTELEEELFDDEEEDEEEEDDDEEDSQATQSEAELEFVGGRQPPPLLPGPVKRREGVFDKTGASPAQTRRRVQMDEEDDEDEDDDDVEVVEVVEPGLAAVGGVGANDGGGGGEGAASAAVGYMAMLEEDGGDIDAEMEDAQAMDVAAPMPAPAPARGTYEDGAGAGGALGRPASGASLSQTIEVIDISDDEAEAEAEAEAEEEASGMAVAQQQGGALLEELLDALEDLRDEGFLEREEQRQLRNRATLQDPAVVEAFLGAKRAGGDANAMARAFRRVLGGAM